LTLKRAVKTVRSIIQSYVYNLRTVTDCIRLMCLNAQHHNMLCNWFSSLPVFVVFDTSQSELHQLRAALCHVQLQGNVRTSQGHAVVSSPWLHACTSYSKHTTDSNIICLITVAQMDNQQQLHSMLMMKQF